MDLTLRSFKKFAASGSENAIIQVSIKNDTLKNPGFWGRLFGASKISNQDDIAAFLGAVKKEKGEKAWTYARQLLITAFEEGKPLAAFMIRGVLDFIDAEDANLKDFNEKQLDTYFKKNSPEGSPFEKTVASLLPDGVALEEIDTSALEKRIRLCGEKNSPFLQHDPEIPAYLQSETKISPFLQHAFKIPSRFVDISQTVDRFVRDRIADDLKSCTKDFLTDLDRWCEAGLPGKLTPQQVQELRPMIIAYGIRTESQLKVTVDITQYYKDHIANLRSMQNTTDALQFLHGLNTITKRSFMENNVDTSWITSYSEDNNDTNGIMSSILAVALSTALKETGQHSTLGMELENLNYQTLEGTMAESTQVLKLANENFNNVKYYPSYEKMNTKFPEISEMISMFYHFGDAVRTVSHSSSYSSYRPFPSQIQEIPEECLNFFYLEKIIPKDEKTKVLFSNTGLDMTREFSQIPSTDLARLLASFPHDSVTENRLDGFQFAVAHLNKLKTLQPDGKPFTPNTIWSCLFNESLPKKVTAHNLLENIDKRWLKICQDKITSEDGMETFRTCWYFPMFFGVDPHRVLDIFTSEGRDKCLLFRDLKTPYHDRIATKEQDADYAIQLSAKDFHRRGQSSSIQFGGMDIISLASSPLQAKDKKDYVQGGVTNPIVEQIKKSATDLVGSENQRQLAALLVLLGQRSTNLLRNCSIFLSLPFTEHSPSKMTVNRGDNGSIRLDIATVNAEPRYAALSYDIKPDGSYDLVDLIVTEEK